MAHVNECDAVTLFDAPASGAIAAGPSAFAAADEEAHGCAPACACNADRDDRSFATFGEADAR